MLMRLTQTVCHRYLPLDKQPAATRVEITSTVSTDTLITHLLLYNTHIFHILDIVGTVQCWDIRY